MQGPEMGRGLACQAEMKPVCCVWDVGVVWCEIQRRKQRTGHTGLCRLQTAGLGVWILPVTGAMGRC